MVIAKCATPEFDETVLRTGINPETLDWNDLDWALFKLAHPNTPCGATCRTTGCEGWCV